MRQRYYTVTASAVQHHAVKQAQHYLRLADHGPKTKATHLFAILFWAATYAVSLAQACARLKRAPSDQAVRDALFATLPEFHELQRRLNQALAGAVPKPVRRRKQRVAIDLIQLPYYGLPQSDPAEIYKGAAKAGTHHFHAYATAYVIWKGCRLTLGLRAVHHSDPWNEVVKDLLRQVRKTGVQVSLVLLDRGFYSVAVIRYLQAARYPFLMPVIRRGRRPDHPKGPSGTWVFTTRRRSGWAQYTLEDKGGRRATVNLCICCPRQVPSRPGARRRRGRQVWLYAYWGVQPSSVSWVRETYRQRFGIESSYRQLHQALIPTTSRSPQLRLFYVGLALLLRNEYVWLHWEVLAYKRRGYRAVDLNQLPLQAMLGWLALWAVELFGLNLERQAQRPFPNPT